MRVASSFRLVLLFLRGRPNICTQFDILCFFCEWMNEAKATSACSVSLHGIVGLAFCIGIYDELWHFPEFVVLKCLLMYICIYIYRYIHMFIFHLKKHQLTRQNYSIFQNLCFFLFLLMCIYIYIYI
jgi:hypothetical protein